MAGIHFVAQTGTKDDDQETRRAIRRHVMLGKNQGKSRLPKQPKLSGCTVFRTDDWSSVPVSGQPALMRGVGSSLSFIEFADAVDPHLMHDTLQFCSTSDQKLFVLEPYITFNSANKSIACLQTLAYDALHLHVMVFSTQAYMNQVFWQTTSATRSTSRNVMSQHYGKALQLLRNRLMGAEQQQPEVFDIIIMSIVPLAMQALFTGDSLNASNHMTGLRKLVNTRRQGLYSLVGKTKLMIELLRCDISISLATGQTPLLFADPAYEPFFPHHDLPLPGQKLEFCPVISNDEIVHTWRSLDHFCAMISNAATEQQKVPDHTLLRTIAAAMYRLLNLSTPQGSADEAIRLAMLCFCASAFLRWCQLRPPFHWLRLECSRSLKSFTQSQSALLEPGVLLWYIVTYILTFSPLLADEKAEAQSWLVKVTASSGVTTWDGVRTIVAKYLWIDTIYQPQARKTIEEVLSTGSASSYAADTGH